MYHSYNSNNGSLNTVVQYTYDAWGKLIDTTGTKAGTIGKLNPFRYRGYVYDEETELYYVSSRYYDPEVGRFINADTTGVLLATPLAVTDKNLFAYCDNNPVVRADDGGAFWNVVFGAVVGAVTSLVTSVVSEIVETVNNENDSFTWSDVGQIAISTVIGAAEGALTAICPGAAPAISAGASVLDTTLNGVIDGDSVEKIVTDAAVSGMISAVTCTGPDFAKGDDLLNDAMGMNQKIDFPKGVHPSVKKNVSAAARHTTKQARTQVVPMMMDVCPKAQAESLVVTSMTGYAQKQHEGGYYSREVQRWR